MNAVNQFRPLSRRPRDGSGVVPVSVRNLDQSARYLTNFRERLDSKSPLVVMKSDRFRSEGVVLAPQFNPHFSVRKHGGLKGRVSKIYEHARSTTLYSVASGISHAEDLVTLRHVEDAACPTLVVPNIQKKDEYVELLEKKLLNLCNHLVKTPAAIPMAVTLDVMTNFPPITPPGTETIATTVAVFDIDLMTRLQISRFLKALKKGNVTFKEDASLQPVEDSAMQGDRYGAVLALDAADGIGENNGINGQFTRQNVLLAAKFMRED